MTKANGEKTRALVPRKAGSGAGAVTEKLTRHDLVESRLYPHIRTKEQAGVVMARAINHDLCPTFVAENLIPIQGKMAGTGLYLAAVLNKNPKYRTVTAANDRTKAVIEFWELVPYVGKDGGPGWVKKGTETFTVEDAKAAGLLGNKTWQQYPQHMCYWRALAGGARKHCPDAIAGAFKYLAEELADGSYEFDEDGVLVSPPCPSQGKPKPDSDVIDAEVVGLWDGTCEGGLEGLRERVKGLIEKTGTDVKKVEAHLGCPVDEAGAGDLVEVAKALNAKASMPKHSKK